MSGAALTATVLAAGAGGLGRTIFGRGLGAGTAAGSPAIAGVVSAATGTTDLAAAGGATRLRTGAFGLGCAGASTRQSSAAAATPGTPAAAIAATRQAAGRALNR